MRDLTQCVHHPAVSQEGFATLAVPTYRASTIVYDDAETFAARSNRGFDGYTYGLHGTPTTRTLEAQFTALHGGVRTVLVPSGQAAVTIVMLSVLMPGDRVLIPDHVYPPVRTFCATYLKPRGIDFDVYDPLIGAGHLRPHRRSHQARLDRIARVGHHGGAGRAGHRGRPPRPEASSSAATTPGRRPSCSSRSPTARTSPPRPSPNMSAATPTSCSVRSPWPTSPFASA